MTLALGRSWGLIVEFVSIKSRVELGLEKVGVMAS